MSARSLMALVGIAALMGPTSYGTSRHRPQQRNRTRLEQASRAHANRPRKLALTSKRRNRRSS